LLFERFAAESGQADESHGKRCRAEKHFFMHGVFSF
jgi:hypothetical protein